MIKLALHPVFQVLATALAVPVFIEGLKRFRSLHLKQRLPFNWPRHVRWGTAVMGSWLTGLIGGLVIAKLSWSGFLTTGLHGRIGAAMAPLLLFGLVSGIYMDRNKKKRTLLPLLHGANNTVILILVFVQAWTGWRVLQIMS